MLCPLPVFLCPRSQAQWTWAQPRQRCVLEPGPWTRGSLTFGGPIVLTVMLNCTHILHETER